MTGYQFGLTPLFWTISNYFSHFLIITPLPQHYLDALQNKGGKIH